MKCFPQKIVFFHMCILGMTLLHVLLLSIVCDNLNRLEALISARISMQETVNIQKLNVDTIHCEEIEIFPLCDLDGNIVE